MPLSWDKIQNKALAFSKRWEDATLEDSEAKPFWIDCFEIFGIRRPPERAHATWLEPSH